jgi:hypothetical protein
MDSLKQRFKNRLKKVTPYRVQADIRRIFLSKLFNKQYGFEVREASRILRDLQHGNIKTVLIVYDNLTVPPSYGDHFCVVMFARYFISHGITVSYIIVDGEYRSDWSGLDKGEIKSLVAEYVYTANLLLDSRLATVEVLTPIQFETRVNESIANGIYIPFRESVTKRIAIYTHMLNILSRFCSGSSQVFLDRFLLSFDELIEKCSFDNFEQPYITWHVRYSEKWGYDRNTSDEEFSVVYGRLRALYPQHAIMVVSDTIGCDHFKRIAGQHNFNCIFSKDYSDTIMGDGVLILGSDYFFTLRGGGIAVFPIFSQLPYEQVVAPTNQSLWQHERLTSWAPDNQIFRRPHIDKNIWPTLGVTHDSGL